MSDGYNIKQHREHTTDGRWHDDCYYCIVRRESTAGHSIILELEDKLAAAQATIETLRHDLEVTEDVGRTAMTRAYEWSKKYETQRKELEEALANLDRITNAGVGDMLRADKAEAQLVTLGQAVGDLEHSRNCPRYELMYSGVLDTNKDYSCTCPKATAITADLTAMLAATRERDEKAAADAAVVNALEALRKNWNVELYDLQGGWVCKLTSRTTVPTTGPNGEQLRSRTSKGLLRPTIEDAIAVAAEEAGEPL